MASEALSRVATAERPKGRRLRPLVILLVLVFAVMAVANGRRDRKAQSDLALASRVSTPAPERAAARGEPSTAARIPAKPAPEPSSRPVEDPARRSTPPPRPTSPDEATPRAVSTSHSWYEDAAGFMRGMEEARAEGKAVLVYFYTDWCPYCRRLDRDLLARVAVANTTRYFVKIKVNPEHGPAERILADRYGISGYPSLYVHEAGSDRTTKLRTTTRGRLLRPSEFAASLERAAGEVFTSG